MVSVVEPLLEIVYECMRVSPLGTTHTYANASVHLRTQ